MGRTKIEWTERTWNPVTGCTRVSPGCQNCYAERMARRLAGQFGYPEAPHHFDVTLHPERLDIPFNRKKLTTYFVCSMGDLFHKDIRFEFIASVFRQMQYADWHVFQVLTKRPRRMREFMETVHIHRCPLSNRPEKLNLPLPNVWLGVSAENQETANERIPILLDTPAAVRFVSIEPMLGPVRFLDVDSETAVSMIDSNPRITLYPGDLIDWVIVGGESGSGARPMHPDWARSVRDECVVSNVPFFFKQWGAWTPDGQHFHRRQQGGIAHDHGSRYSCQCEYVDGQGQFRDTNDLGPIHGFSIPDDWAKMYRIGKKKAGRELDGRIWGQVPEAYKNVS